MKKRLALLVALTMLMSIFAVPVFAADWSSKWSEDTAILSNESAENEVATLYAGQSLEVGKVYINSLGSNKYLVTYQIDAEDWYLAEVHFEAVNESDLNFIRSAKNGNLIPGQFTVKEKFDLADKITEFSFEYTSYAIVTDFAAHAVVGKQECVVNAEAPYGGYDVIEWEQGSRYDNTPVLPIRSNPNSALFYETGYSASYFFSLGFQDFDDDNPTTAYIIIEFDDPIVNGDGPDLQVVEDTWGLPYPNENAKVYVSNDGINWELVGTAGNQNPINSYHTVSNFELPEGWESAKYVKVQDASIRSDFYSKYPSQKDTLDGYDLNAVLALHDNKTCTEYSETAWGYAGDFERDETGNWSTIIPNDLD